MPETPWYDKSPMPIPAAGAFLFALGLIGVLLGVVLPSTIGVREVLLTACGLPCLVLGFIYMLFGPKAVSYLGEPQNARSWRIRYWGSLCAIGAALSWAIRSHNGA